MEVTLEPISTSAELEQSTEADEQPSPPALLRAPSVLPPSQTQDAARPELEQAQDAPAKRPRGKPKGSAKPKETPKAKPAPKKGATSAKCKASTKLL